MVEFALVRDRVALVNVDIQNCFVEGAADGLVVVERINELASACRAAGIPVIHVRHALAADADAGVLGEIAPIVRDGFLDRDAEGTALHPRLVVGPTDQLLEKPHFGAFQDTDLEALLRGRGIDTIIVTGIETNVCCETTAREAMVRGFRVVFMSDGTTTAGVPGLTVDEVQRASLATLGTFFAQVATVADTIARLPGRS